MQKPTQVAMDTFADAIPDDARVEERKMFGMPCAFVNNNMFMGVFADGITLRMPAPRIAELQAMDGVGKFEPKAGSPWKEYVFVQCGSWAGSQELTAWASEALAHTATLPPKVKKAKKKK